MDKKISRRSFMKKAAVMGTAVTAFPTVFVRKAPAMWEPKTVIHPNVDNLRVVGITDTQMTKAVKPVSSWAVQEELVNKDIVWDNIDKLACTLTQTESPKEAWQAIFVKPPKKSWSDTVVAIKTNHISVQHTRSAVMSKICHTLTNTMGVKPSNIHIYDASKHGTSLSRDTPFAGLPDGCKIVNQWGGNFKSAIVEVSGSQSNAQCLGHLVDGSVDILINIAMCKGHRLSQLGQFTMTMKNHFGTFAPRPGHAKNGMDYLVGINKSSEILGPMDKQTGKVLYPRQQLCFVDALWSSEKGPSGNPSHQPNFLGMGVFSPIVDYVLATRFRRDKMGYPLNMDATQQLLTDFGYTEADLPNGGNIIEV
jgi:hypothetical protein